MFSENLSSGQYPHIFTYLKTVLFTVGALIIRARTRHANRDFKMTLQRNGVVSGANLQGVKNLKISELS